MLESSDDYIVSMEGRNVNAANIETTKDDASGVVFHTDNNSAAVGSRISEFVVHTNFVMSTL
jgi:hypothetical protein